jgi:acyl carrier protein phosphodiesterase
VYNRELYADLHAITPALPAEIQPVVTKLVAEDWFGSYRRLDGIEHVLGRMSQRISARLGRDVRLDTAMDDLQRHYAELRADFAAFFPLIRREIVEAHADDYHH